MSKRKRKQNKKRKGQAKTDSPDSTTAGEANVTETSPNDKTAKPKSRLGLLLVLALLLLPLAGVVNYQRWQSTREPDAVPFPSVPVVARPLAPPSKGGEKCFTLLSPSETGVDFGHPVIADHPMAYLYFSSTAAGGTAVGDVNGDGRPDLFIASGPKENRLYVQTDRNFQFEDITDTAGVGGGNAWACGATMVDINADGWLDIFVANYDSPNQLFVNLGDGTFREQADDYLVNITDASLEGTFADYDRDGDLDHYLVTYRYENPAGMPENPPIVYRGTERSIQREFQKYYEVTEDAVGYGVVGRSDGLLRNNGDGTFSDTSFQAGIHGVGHGQSATWWDFNGDDLVDLHVGNDFNDPDRLYKNNGDGTFTNIVREAVPHITWFSMGSDAGDINADGLPDLLTTDMSSTTHFKQKTTMGAMGDNAEFLSKAIPRQYMRNALLLNSGTDRFKEAAYLTGLDSTDWTWSVKLADFDCDGKLDVFFTNGSVRSFTDSDRTLSLSQRKGKTEWDIYKNTEPLRESNLAFRNDGNLNFTNASKEWGLDHLGVSMSAAHADFDGDGDLDLVVANVDEPIGIYRNDSQEGNRVALRLHGRGANRYGIGAKIHVSSATTNQTLELHPSRGFLASNQPLVFFATSDDTVDLDITWPTGNTQRITGLKTGKHYEITEPSERTEKPTNPPATRYTTRDGPDALKHQENEFDDYQLQPLLPHRMSRLGPSLASGDVNGDGRLDFFVGGASGSPGRVVMSDEDNEFSFSPQPALEADATSEDMGAIWFDVDNDGDVDLLVAGGGNENQDMTSDAYALRLYENDGSGALTRLHGVVPDVRVSAGPIAACDFDQDGDVDLFIGGRQVPGKYPLPAKSYLLVNDGGEFVDATDQWMDSAEIGMVTGALWSDVDNDSDLDLLTTTEWGSVRLFRNEKNKLTDSSAAAGLTGYRGWWTGISPGDFNNDGSMDYVVTNMGTNTKYHATDKHPFRLYYGDFEGNGQRKLVEAEYEGDTLFPVRGKSCSTHAMPSLANKFTTYKDFAGATLDEIYTPQCLEESFECSANWLSSVVLLNNGRGEFTVQPLPNEVQLSPGFGVVVTELTGDQFADIFIAQNFFSPQPETGNMDGGLGCLLAGNGDGTFSVASTRESGVIVPEDATAVLPMLLNNDSALDLIVATNNDHLRVIESNSAPPTLQVRIANAKSSSSVAGTRIRLVVPDSATQTAELASGSGYLSQQPPEAYFASPTKPGRIVATFPDGKTIEVPFEAGAQKITIERRTLNDG